MLGHAYRRLQLHPRCLAKQLQRLKISSVLREALPDDAEVVPTLAVAKSALHHLSNVVGTKPIVERSTEGDSWKVQLSLSWPESLSFVSKPCDSVKEAERQVFSDACSLLEKRGVLDKEFRVRVDFVRKLIDPDSVERPRWPQPPEVLLQQLFAVGRQPWPQGFARELVQDGTIIRSKVSLNLNWPERDLSFTAEDLKIVQARKRVCELAFLELKKTLKKDVDDLAAELEQQKANSLTHFGSDLTHVKMTSDVASCLDDLFTETEIDSDQNLADNSWMSGLRQKVPDIITGTPLNSFSAEVLLKKSETLRQKLAARRQATEVDWKPLPILARKEAILDAVAANQTVLVCGETGCGKTTQVPQFIFDQHVEAGAGARCNIVVTQPRRISCVSVATRLASERGECLGESVGYKIRLQHDLPASPGGIVFNTPGILLRSILHNQNLEGVSHVILDEIHERDLWTDFLLIILKKILKKNKNLRLILMSASVQPEKFSSYFDNCPVVRVSGRMFPVREYFLEDLEEVFSRLPAITSDAPAPDHVAVVETLLHIHRRKPAGAALCFLPSWSDMLRVKRLLETRAPLEARQMDVHMCHSRVPLTQQQRIFQRPPGGKRKVILSTNIAESSITIDDVVYVVNTGCVKDRFVDAASDTRKPTLVSAVKWSSRASQLQRRGRAGRLQKGECYHLFPAHILPEMEEYSTPGLLAHPLESVVLLSKAYSPLTHPEDFLCEALDPPHESQVDEATRTLAELGMVRGGIQC